VDPLLGRPVRLDAESLQAKLIAAHRGGYCFEQNGLFLLALRELGFEVTPLAARVVWMAPAGSPRSPLSHMLLKVDLPEGPFLADVGFGGQSPTAPLRLEPGPEQATPHGVYRVVEGPEGYEVQMRLPDRWEGMYRFRDEPQGERDYEVFNHYTATHPASRFTQNLIAARVDGELRLNLFNDQLTTWRPDGRSDVVRLASPAQAHAALAHDFGIEVPLAGLERVWERLPKSDH
jgi:N-hydroxyarylamine O-acetyltransferase